MSKWSEQKIRLVKDSLKVLLVKNPNISCWDIAKQLKIDKNVALRYRDEVISESIVRIKNDEVKKELAKIQDEYEMIALECWKVITSEYVEREYEEIIMPKDKRKKVKKVKVKKKIYITPKEKMSAIRELSNARHKLFESKLNAGVFQRNLGELNITEQHTLEDINKLSKDKQKEIYDKIIGIKRLLGRPAKPNRKK